MAQLLGRYGIILSYIPYLQHSEIKFPEGYSKNLQYLL